ALRSVYKALKPGGMVIICEPGKGHSKNQGSRDAVSKFNVNEKDMPPGHVIALGKKIGFKDHMTYPRMLQLYKAVYTKPRQQRVVGGLFKFGIIRLIAVLYTLLFYKHHIGLVVLVK
ncbi:MAG: hypothetical protein ACYC5N_07970, partial [Endomicrobiales bacterium]